MPTRAFGHFRLWWDGGTFSTNLDVIWGMSDDTFHWSMQRRQARSMSRYLLCAAGAGAVCLGLTQLCPSGSGGHIAHAAEMNRWEAAGAAIVRLAPTAFPQLPEAVAVEMERRRCTVPQPWEGFANGAVNVISGESRKPGQIDWAVLCSVDRISALLVFWNGSPGRVEEVAGTRGPDRGGLQVVTKDSIGFSRMISPVGERYILEHYAWYGGPEPPPIDHQGINYTFVEKASVVLYWHDGEWRRLQGAD